MIKKHWTPTYIVNKLRTMSYYRQNPTLPWITKDANNFLIQWMDKSKVGIEFGSGRSTLWLGKNCGKLYSVEDNKAWFDKISASIKEQQLTNIEYFYLDSSERNNQYVQKLDTFPDGFFDFVFIDGSHRDLLALKAVSKVKNKGGMVIIDNINWFLPHNTISPASVKPGEPHYNKNWELFEQMVAGFELVWTSNGVSDTAFFIKK